MIKVSGGELSTLLKAITENSSNNDEETLPSTEAQVMRLEEILEVIKAGNKWKPGDFVTARRDSPLLGHGRPMIVIEVHPTEMTPPINGNSTGTDYSKDTVVLFCAHDRMCTVFGAHWQFEKYDFDREYTIRSMKRGVGSED